jgi:hypothetical protein
MATVRGGDRFETTLEMMARMMTNASAVHVGFLEEAKYPAGKSVAMIAAIQNFGAPSAGIPPRPFFTDMIKKRSPEWPKAIRDLLVANQYDALRVLQLTGEGITGQLRKQIQDTNAPPLSKATIRRKGFDKPLIDTGHMWNSVDYQVQA